MKKIKKHFSFLISHFSFSKGFTYLELILYMGIITIMLATLVLFALNVIEGGAKTATEREIFSQGQYVGERIKYEIRNATGINSVSPTQISLSESNPATNPTVIALSSGNITLQQGASSPVIINSKNTVVSGITFTNNTSSDSKTKNIQFAFTIAANYPGAGARQEYNGSTTIESTAEILANASYPTPLPTNTPTPTPTTAIPPVFDASSKNSVASSTSMSWSHTTTTNANRLITVSVQVQGVGVTVSGVTYAGASLTKAGSIIGNCNSVANQCDAEIWYLKAPATGTNTVQVNVTGGTATAIIAGAITFYSVDQTTPVGTAATTTANTGSPHTVTVSNTNTNQIVVDSDADSRVITVNSPQVQVQNQITGNIDGGASYRTGAATNTTMSWSSDTTGVYAMVGVPIN